MCTALTYRSRDFYFGRTLDYEHTHGEEVVIIPRTFPLPFRFAPPNRHHHAIIGMTRVEDGYPLLFDAVNEHGLAMAGLNFVGYAHYGLPTHGKENVAQFELIPKLLSVCTTVREAVALLHTIHLTNTPFSTVLPPASLHWLLADKTETVTLEWLSDGLHIHPNPLGILTNNPPFDVQMLRLADFCALSPGSPENHLAPNISLPLYSRGMGALGLPGDWSSGSRFVRAAFLTSNTPACDSEEENVGQFFHMLDPVSQVRGATQVSPGKYDITQYTACINATRGIYYYTTYQNRRITAVDMHHEDLDGDTLLRYPLRYHEDILLQNR